MATPKLCRKGLLTVSQIANFYVSDIYIGFLHINELFMASI
jgi:hypothetical protein